MDLEGIVAKRQNSLYRATERRSHWIKIKNSRYSQAEGRQELFERGTQSGPHSITNLIFSALSRVITDRGGSGAYTLQRELARIRR